MSDGITFLKIHVIKVPQLRHRADYIAKNYEHYDKSNMDKNSATCQVITPAIAISVDEEEDGAGGGGGHDDDDDTKNDGNNNKKKRRRNRAVITKRGHNKQ